MIAMLIAVMLSMVPVPVVEHTVLGNFLVDITDIDPDVVADPEWRRAVRDQCRIDFDVDNKNFIDSTPMGLCVFDTGKRERLSQYDCVYNTDGTWYPTEDSITAGLNEYVCCCDNNGGCFVVNAPNECNLLCTNGGITQISWSPGQTNSCTATAYACSEPITYPTCTLYKCGVGTCSECLYGTSPSCHKTTPMHHMGGTCETHCEGACCTAFGYCNSKKHCECEGENDIWGGFATYCNSAIKNCCYNVVPNLVWNCVPTTLCQCLQLEGTWSDDPCTGRCEWWTRDDWYFCTIYHCEQGVTEAKCNADSAGYCEEGDLGLWVPCIPCPACPIDSDETKTFKFEPLVPFTAPILVPKLIFPKPL